jgi:drug/metabolite transporter (DMT)-like permease
MSEPKRPIITTAAGSKAGAYGPAEWGLLSWTTFMWGSSFLWIAIGLEGFTPGMVAFLRLVLGAGALALIPAARRRIAREDWPAVAIVSVAGNAGPALLFAVAEQTVESSVAGMINSAVPLATAAISFMLGQRSLRPVHIVGLVGGLGGVLLLSVPTMSGTDPAVMGMLLLFLAVIGYAISNNLLVPLQHRYGGIPVIMQAQLLGVVVLAPWGLWDLGANDPSLGVAFRSETISPIELVGLAVVLISAFLVTRAVR